MATWVVPGQTTWKMERDEEGHRIYRIIFRVRSDDPRAGPAQVLLTPGLPQPGQPWAFDNDLDIWAWCRFDTAVNPQVDNEANLYWTVEFRFSTKPPDNNKQRCQDNRIEDPLLEPQRVRGEWSSDKREVGADRFGRAIMSSSWEVIRGPEVEFEILSPGVEIEQNVLQLDLPLLKLMSNKVNDRPLWGLPARTVRLSKISWEKKYHGLCSVYYTRKFSFAINNDEFNPTWDRDVLDEGTKALNGFWNSLGEWELINIDGEEPDPFNPQHFNRFKDRNGENCRVVLNGFGLPAGVVISQAVSVYYMAANNGVNPFTTGKKLTNSKYWVPLAEGVVNELGTGLDEENIVPWEQGNYPRGAVVLAGPDPNNLTLYVALQDVTGPFGDAEPSTSIAWGQIEGNSVSFEGEFDINASYQNNHGVIVIPDSFFSLPGYRHIEYYKEANFLLLGIPTVL